MPAFSYLRITKLNIVNIWLDGSKFCDSFQVINVTERYMLLVSLIERLKYRKYSVSLGKCLNDKGLNDSHPLGKKMKHYPRVCTQLAKRISFARISPPPLLITFRSIF
jgi:hypothetical protein